MYNFVIRLLACFIPNQQKRRNFRNKHIKPTFKDLVKRIGDLESCKVKKNVLIDDGKNNKKVWFDDDGNETPITEPISGIDIIIHGNNNVLRLSKDIVALSSKIEIGNDDVFIEIQKTRRFEGVYIRADSGKGQRLIWGGDHLLVGYDFIGSLF